MPSKKVMTPEFRASYVSLDRPKAGLKDPNEKFYSICMIFDKDADLSELKQLVHDTMMARWGKKPGGFQSPFFDGTAYNEKHDGKHPYCVGKICANAKNKEEYGKPGQWDLELDAPIVEEGAIYSGCYCRATVTAYTYDTGGNRGVSFGLQNVAKAKDGDRLAGRDTAENDFASVKPKKSTASYDLEVDYEYEMY